MKVFFILIYPLVSLAYIEIAWYPRDGDFKSRHGGSAIVQMKDTRLERQRKLSISREYTPASQHHDPYETSSDSELPWASSPPCSRISKPRVAEHVMPMDNVALQPPYNEGAQHTTAANPRPYTDGI